MTERFAHRLPFGAEYHGDETLFRIWAPSAERLTLELDGVDHEMVPEGDDWHVATIPAKVGAKYKYRMPDSMAFPDPASRAQAGGVHDESLVVDACSYEWQNPDWKGRPWHETILYELHPGVMGGFDGIRAQLPRIAALGVTAIELMPVSQFPGAHNWGYDGVLPYAPDSSYGTPDQFKALVDAAHGLGLMVFLDVVYNHFGPDGAYIHAFAKTFFREDKHTPWGAAIDLRRASVRDYFEQNALYWVKEYRLDGLRFDALHALGDPDWLDTLARFVRMHAEPGRHIHLVMEHENNAARHLKDAPDAQGFDAQWTDDFHHAMHVMLTGEVDGYYEDFPDATEKLARVLTEGFAYQGEVSKHSGKPRGEPSAHLPTTAFVVFLQNHDQTGNRALGERLTAIVPQDRLRAATTLLLMSPFIPLLFMGEEVESKTPFLFFTDHHDELAELVRTGRREEFKHFPAFKDPARRDSIPDPNAATTFQASIPDFSGDTSFVQKLLEVRKARVVPGIVGCTSAGVEILAQGAMLARWRLGTGEMLCIAFNFGEQSRQMASPAGEVLFESPAGTWGSVKDGRLQQDSAVAWIVAKTDAIP